MSPPLDERAPVRTPTVASFVALLPAADVLRDESQFHAQPSQSTLVFVLQEAEDIQARRKSTEVSEALKTINRRTTSFRRPLSQVYT